MNCEEVRELLSPYLDRELTSDEMTAIAEHLEDCPDCMHKSTIFGQLSKVIKHWEGIKASEEAKHRLMEQVRRASVRSRTKKTLPLMLLLLLAGALLLGGTAALIVWLLGREPARAPEVERAAVAECVHRANRVEVVTGGAPVLVKGRRKLYAGQRLICNLGAAAQLRWPADGRRRARFVLRGPADLLLADENTLTLRGKGRLVFHLEKSMSGGPGFVMKAGRWRVFLPGDHGPTVGLIEVRADGGIRAAMLTGSVRLGKGGPRIMAGTEVTMDIGGTLGTPKKISNTEAFELLAGDKGK